MKAINLGSSANGCLLVECLARVRRDVDFVHDWLIARRATLACPVLEPSICKDELHRALHSRVRSLSSDAVVHSYCCLTSKRSMQFIAAENRDAGQTRQMMHLRVGSGSLGASLAVRPQKCSSKRRVKWSLGGWDCFGHRLALSAALVSNCMFKKDSRRLNCSHPLRIISNTLAAAAYPAGIKCLAYNNSASLGRSAAGREDALPRKAKLLSPETSAAETLNVKVVPRKALFGDKLESGSLLKEASARSVLCAGRLRRASGRRRRSRLPGREREGQGRR